MLTGYPRPQFQRTNWLNLNGQWDFSFDDNKIGEKDKWYEKFPHGNKINVPYSYETKLSGIGIEELHTVVWYEKRLELEVDHTKKTILNFEGVDYNCKVWVNSYYVGGHQGGYAAFALDITDYLINGMNKITVKVEDSYSAEIPRGKQRWKSENFGCWYVQTTGIWKTVWLESVPKFYMEKIKITPDLDRSSVEIVGKFQGTSGGKDFKLRCDIILEDQIISSTLHNIIDNDIKITVELSSNKEPWKLAVWAPHSPRLYDVKFILLEEENEVDTMYSYFGMRKISIEGDKVLLNNLPLYQKLILDQGYWEDSHLTPPSEEAIIKDIDLILEAGYNGVRKHQKVEDNRFLYWCDKKGLLVWSEMASSYSFTEKAVMDFTREWMEIVEQNYNHPSIITWTPFNESWGIEQIFSVQQQQKFTEAIYHLTKTFDAMRPVIVNDGWEHTVSDIITLHDYVERGEEFIKRYKDKENILKNKVPFNVHRYAFAKGYEYKGQPVILSEYGGIALSSDNGWGYGEQVRSEEAFIERFDSITSAIKELDYICGFCYTQVTDVQQEINGLYNMKREAKVDIKRIREINNR